MRGIICFTDEDPDTKRINRVFWTYEWCIKMWAYHPEILLFDKTYRTNQFNMPLLNISGITGLHTNFPVAFVLTSDETEASFLWSLNRLAFVAKNERMTIEVEDGGDKVKRSRWGPRNPEIPSPLTVMSDYDRAFKNAAKGVFKEAQQQLCVWHMMKNIFYNVKRLWNGQLGDFAGGRRAGPSESEQAEEKSQETWLQNKRIDPGNNRYDDNPPDKAEHDIADTMNQSPVEKSEVEDSPKGLVQAWRQVVYAETKEDCDKRWAEIKVFFHLQPRMFSLHDLFCEVN